MVIAGALSIGNVMCSSGHNSNSKSKAAEEGSKKGESGIMTY